MNADQKLKLVKTIIISITVIIISLLVSFLEPSSLKVSANFNDCNIEVDCQFSIDEYTPNSIVVLEYYLICAHIQIYIHPCDNHGNGFHISELKNHSANKMLHNRSPFS